MTKKINIYTDGSSIGNPGPGGYGIIMVLENNAYKKEVSQGFSLTTNNRMELLAVIVALENIKIISSNVEVFTDSKYVSDAVEKKWVFEWEKLNFKKAFDLSSVSVAERALKNTCLAYLTRLGEFDIAYQQFMNSECMTDQFGAFQPLLNNPNPYRDEVIERFYNEHHSDVQVMDKWFSAQSVSSLTSVDDVKSRLDIVEVVSQRVPLQRSGNSYKAPCPFHQENTPSFHVFPDRQSWRCFGACATGGDVLSFVMRAEGLEFGEALRQMAQQAGVTLPQRGQNSQNESAYKLNEDTRAYFQRTLASAQGASTREYLDKRGLDKQIIESFGVGLSPADGESLKNHLTREGYTPQDLINAGVVRVGDDGVSQLLQHESGVVSLSDAGAHLVFMCDAGFGLHFLAKWVRERGDFNLAQGIRRLTSHPADLYGLIDRGRIAPGAHADLLLFDPETVGVTATHRVHDLPGGGPRTIRHPVGVHGVFVNGVEVFDGENYVNHSHGPGEVLSTFAPSRNNPSSTQAVA